MSILASPENGYFFKAHFYFDRWTWQYGWKNGPYWEARLMTPEWFGGHLVTYGVMDDFGNLVKVER